MKYILFLLFIFTSVLTTSCIKKVKETDTNTKIIMKSSDKENTPQAVQIPMHGTKENSSSGMENNQLKEQMTTQNTTKDTLKK